MNIIHYSIRSFLTNEYYSIRFKTIICGNTVTQSYWALLGLLSVIFAFVH